MPGEALWDAIDLPMQDTLTVALSEKWRDCLTEVCLVPLTIIVWGEVPDLCRLLPEDTESRCHIMHIGVAAAPPGACRTPGADLWLTEPFWDAVFAETRQYLLGHHAPSYF